MRIIDARSGKDLIPGCRVSYSDGESVTLLSATPGIFSTKLTADVVRPNHLTGELEPQRIALKVPVRYTHPSFFLQPVAFWPS